MAYILYIPVEAPRLEDPCRGPIILQDPLTPGLTTVGRPEPRFCGNIKDFKDLSIE